MSALATIRKNGNSIVVTIPREELDAAGVAVGDLVSVTLRPVEIRTALRADLRAILDSDFEQWRPVLQGLYD